MHHFKSKIAFLCASHWALKLAWDKRLGKRFSVLRIVTIPSSSPTAKRRPSSSTCVRSLESIVYCLILAEGQQVRFTVLWLGEVHWQGCQRQSLQGGVPWSTRRRTVDSLPHWDPTRSWTRHHRPHRSGPPKKVVPHLP